jgi:4-amino-4-deoxy-L-arabinose transferase-like glycosyltransferase
MLQAFLPLPALYALYFLGARKTWARKIVHLAVTTIVLLSVSLSWVVAVDLTPTDQQPYVGSSSTNSALELAIGYNGLQRLLGGLFGAGRGRGAGAPAQVAPPTNADGQPLTAPDRAMPPSALGDLPPAGGTFPAPAGGQRPGGVTGGMFGGEIGAAGVFRLFTQPLDNEIGWLLPFGLFSLGLLLIARPRLPLSTDHQGALLWGGWLVTAIVFFSAAGFFHAYYLAMLAPPLGALVGMGVTRLWRLFERRKLLASLLLVVAAGGTLALQLMIASGYTDALAWAVIPVIVLAAAAVLLLLSRITTKSRRLPAVGFACVVIALVTVPAIWSGMTALAVSTNMVLPAAYAGEMARPTDLASLPATAGPMGATAARRIGGFGDDGLDNTLLEFLQANTQGMHYMLAVGSSNQGAPYVLATGRGVLYMGGFSGQDPVIDAAGLQALVDAGELRYVLVGSGVGGMRSQIDGNAGIATWLAANYTIVRNVSTFGGSLYDCGG